MSENYLRTCSIRIDALGKTYTAEGIRVRFNIKQATVAVPNNATIRLTNQNRSEAEALCKDPGAIGKYVSISAGYKGNEGLLFAGHLVRSIYGRENPTDTLTQVLATDGDQSTSFATVSKTLPPGSTPQDHVNVAIAAMAQYGVSLGFVGQGVDLSQPVYPRSVTLFGMARTVLDTVAKSKGATWSVQNLKVDILKTSDVKAGGAFVLNTATGLIGMPTLTQDGVYCRTLINPQMQMHRLVQIDQSLIQGYLPQLGPGGIPLPPFSNAAQGLIVASIAADGIYKIVKIDTEADTRGQPWYMDMLVIVPGERTPVTINYEGAN